MLKHGILGLLNYGDMTGYEIMLVFRDSLAYFWSATTSQIYREIHALEEKGWVTSARVDQDGKPDKNVLSITPQGKEELARWLRDGAPRSVIRNPMLMHVFFRGECGLEENIEYFKSLPSRESVFPDGSSPSGAIEQYAQVVDDPVKALYWKFTVEFGVRYEQMVREWCDSCVAQLEELKDARSHR